MMLETDELSGPAIGNTIGPLTQSGNAVSVRNCSFEYPARRRGTTARRALNNVSLDVMKGELFAFLGPNGSGKSTLFRILSTMNRPTSGSVEILGIPYPAGRDEIRTKIGVVFQHPSLDGKLTARENLLFQGHLYNLRGKFLASRIDDVLKRVGLSTRQDDLVETYSGGMQRRVELAKALLHRPELLILDEPSTGLDPAARKAFAETLESLRKEGVTILLTTHLLDEADTASRIAILDEGSVAGIGRPDDLKREIGGDVITLGTQSPEALRDALTRIFSFDVRIVENTVRIEKEDGHLFIPQMVGALPGLVDSVHLSKPSLEDVFFHKTGHAFHLSPRREEGIQAHE
jgi:ABC-2 type transport system ATP-binding protein